MHTTSSLTQISVPLTPELNPIDTPFKQYLYDVTMKHNQEYEPCVFQHLPQLSDITELCTFGVFAQTLMQSKKQYLSSSGAINIAGELSTVTAVSRAYLDYYHPKPLRAFGALVSATYELPQRPPLYVKPSILLNGTYVDIKSTYFSILCNTGWNISFWQGKWFTPGRRPLDFPLRQCKPARSYLVTGSLKSSVGIYDGRGNTYYRKTRNRHINYELWGYIQCLLHSIAQFAVKELGACYVHTDGYIVKEDVVGDLIAYIGTYGLIASVKATGPTIVCGFANYRCGEKSTKTFHPERKQYTNDKIRWDVNRPWVRDVTANAIKSISQSAI